MAVCVGCNRVELTGRQKKWHSDGCKNAFNRRARLIGTEKMGALLAAAASDAPPEGNAVLPPAKKGHCRAWGNEQIRKLHKLFVAHMTSGREITTAEIHEATGEMAPSTTVSELRRLVRPAYDILPARLIRVTDDGRKVYGYRMVKN